jgi:hypothetical protein
MEGMQVPLLRPPLRNAPAAFIPKGRPKKRKQAFMHPSAWKKRSSNFRSRMPHRAMI